VKLDPLSKARGLRWGWSADQWTIANP